MLTKLCCLLHMPWCAEKKADSRSYLTPSSSIHGVRCPPIFPRSFHGLVLYGLTAHTSQLLFFCFGEIVIYHSNVPHDKLLALLGRGCSHPFIKNAQASNNITASQMNPFPEATRAALPEMGSRADDLNIRQHQIPHFALASF